MSHINYEDYLEEDWLKEEISLINKKLEEMTNVLVKFENRLSHIEYDINLINLKLISNPTHNPIHLQINPTHLQQTDNTPTHNLPFKALKPLNIDISTGNRGVPTDRQTDQQTDKIEEIRAKLHTKTPEISSQDNPRQRLNTTICTTNNKPEEQINQVKQPVDNKQENIANTQNTFDNAISLISSLDSIKKELRLKFKRLTDQEFLVFSTMYQLDEEVGSSNYKLISERLNLTESSIRDYIGRLIKKGIPIEKQKINNKMINLNISANLKKIGTLPTIIQLREI